MVATAGADILIGDYDTLQTQITTNTTAIAALAASYTSHTVSWTGATSNPAIGNGSTIGRYVQIGKLVHYWGKITIGTTTTFGSGAYRISLPVACDSSLAQPLGQAYLRDFGTADYIVAMCQIVTSTTFAVLIANAFNTAPAWTQGTPITLANNDHLDWNCVYPAA